MKSEIMGIILDNTVPSEIKGRAVLAMTDTQMKRLASDLDRYFNSILDLRKYPEDPDLEARIDSVIQYMNQIWGSGFRKNSEGTRKPIRARFREGQ